MKSKMVNAHFAAREVLRGKCANSVGRLTQRQYKQSRYQFSRLSKSPWTMHFAFLRQVAHIETGFWQINLSGAAAHIRWEQFICRTAKGRRTGCTSMESMTGMYKGPGRDLFLSSMTSQSECSTCTITLALSVLYIVSLYYRSYDKPERVQHGGCTIARGSLGATDGF